MIDDVKPVTVARSGEDTEGTVLGCRGATAPVAAIPHKNARGGVACLGTGEDRLCREARVFDPASGDDGRSDQAMPGVQIERQRDVLPVMPEKLTGELGSSPRAVYPTRKPDGCVRIRMSHPVLRITGNSPDSITEIPEVTNFWSGLKRA